MVHIRPFKGYTYNQQKFPDLSPVLAPPYDVISREMRQALIKQSPFNMVNITLSKQNKEGIPNPDFLAKARETWETWKQTQIITQVDEPTIWQLKETFTSPTSSSLTRIGFIAELELEEFSSSDVLCHERTHVKPKLDRMEVMKATYANLSPIFFIYPDDPQQTETLCDQFVANSTTRTRMQVGNTVDLELSATHDKRWIEQFKSQLKNSPILIADGHHRYQASLHIKHIYGNESNLNTSHIMGYFVPASSEGLVIYPTHRGIHSIPEYDEDVFMSKLEDYFTIDDEDDRSNLPTLKLVRSDLKISVLKAKPNLFKKDRSDSSQSLLDELDVFILEEFILKKVLGISSGDISEQKKIEYFHDESSCIDAVRKGHLQLAFLLAPILIETLFSITATGGILPPKSTYFYPKCPTGLVMRSMEVI